MILPTASGPSQPPPAPTPKQVTTSRTQVGDEPPPLYSDGRILTDGNSSDRSYCWNTTYCLEPEGMHTVYVEVVFVFNSDSCMGGFYIAASERCLVTGGCVVPMNIKVFV